MGKLEPAAFESLERLAHGLVSQLRRRLELMAVEVTEEEIRFSRALGWQLLALFLSCLTLTLGVLLVIAAYWDSVNRLAAIGWMLAAAGVASGAMWWIYRNRLRYKPIVFSQTIEELRRDAAALAPEPRDGLPDAPPGYGPRGSHD
jgi:uncharacterized membrane protein YqjE